LLVIHGIDGFQAKYFNPGTGGFLKLQSGLDYPRIVKYQPGPIREILGKPVKGIVCDPPPVVAEQTGAIPVRQGIPGDSVFR
jgi:hypothetical protein